MTKRRQNLKKRIFFAFFSLKTSLPARGTICCAVLYPQGVRSVALCAMSRAHTANKSVFTRKGYDHFVCEK